MLVFHQSNRVGAIKRMFLYYRRISVFVFKSAALRVGVKMSYNTVIHFLDGLKDMRRMPSHNLTEKAHAFSHDCWSEPGDDRPPETYESNFFTIILYNSGNNSHDIDSFCRPLFCHNRCCEIYFTSLTVAKPL